MKIYRILLVDDDDIFSETIIECFELNYPEFNILYVNNGNDALEKFKSESFDLVLLDVCMPEENGYEVLRKIRKIDAIIPVIFVTGTELEMRDKLNAYELGAYDCIEKLFHLDEIAAKMKVWLNFKEHHRINSENFQIGKYFFKLSDRLLVVKDEISVYLKDKQFEVLKILLENHGRIVKRKELLLLVWKNDISNNEQMLRNTIKEIRQILSPLENIKIKTQYGFGYMLIAR
ncbi:DNA-binding response regulator [Bacteroidia bacterium]|nr:DNA-binding response regulator [Bacteroidia bacterium]GHU87329.1 DNA-binding response regulator [Bacteroidia bacterium]